MQSGSVAIGAFAGISYEVTASRYEIVALSCDLCGLKCVKRKSCNTENKCG